MISDIVANLQASEAANDAAVTQAIADLQALPTEPAGTCPTVVSSVETLTFSDGSTVTVNGTVG
jgi:hypothetical protein